jgi:hypothetical protein
MPPSFLLFSRAVCAGGAVCWSWSWCRRAISLCSFLPLRQWSGLLLLFVYFDFVRRSNLELDHWKKNAQSQPNRQTIPAN